VNNSSGLDDVNTNDVDVHITLGAETGDNLTAGAADIWIKVAYLL